MRLRLLVVATVVALMVAGSGAQAVATDAPHTRPSTSNRGVVSHPEEDPYYPRKGDPHFDALHYWLNLSWDRHVRLLTGKATIRFRVARATKSIVLDLGHPMRVRSIRLDGKLRTATHPGNHLVISSGAQARGSRHYLRIRYRGTPKPIKAPTHRTDFDQVGWKITHNGSAWTMQEPFGALTWYPVNDHPSDKAYYNATIHANGGFVGVFNGKLTARTHHFRVTTTHFRLHYPTASYLVTIAIGAYRLIRDTGPHGLPISYWVLKHTHKHLGVLRQTPAMVRWLEKQIGRYPFNRLGVMLVQSRSAMETQTLVTLGNRLFRYPGQLARFDLLHEYAHQWYGDTVTPDNWLDLWMNESFAMYLQIVYEKSHSVKFHWWSYLRTHDKYYRQHHGPPGAYFKGDFGGGSVYYCGALMLRQLKNKIGDKAFANVLRAWPQRHPFSNHDRRDWIRFLNHQTGLRLGHWVTRWLMSKHTPPLQSGLPGSSAPVRARVPPRLLGAPIG
jgi:aminopeptidase N